MAILIILYGGIAEAQPNMSIPNSIFDFGFAPQNSKISHVFWLHSTGTDSLKILKVTPGWGCTQAPLTKKELAVGDSTELEIIFSTGHYSKRQQKSPSISTNEGAEQKSVKILCDVVTNPDSTYPIVIRPYKFDISQYGEKERSSLDFTIQNISDMDLELALIDMPANMFKITLPKKIKAGESAKGKFTVQKEFVPKEFEKSMTIELNDNPKTRFTVPVKRTIRIPGAPQTATPTTGTSSGQGHWKNAVFKKARS